MLGCEGVDVSTSVFSAATSVSRPSTFMFASAMAFSAETCRVIL